METFDDWVRGKFHEVYKLGIEEAKPKWISVDDRLPGKAGAYPCKLRGVLEWSRVVFNNGEFESPCFDVTHWMELPD